jgi:NAD(P)H-nitrite reductase large subunit/rubredoxin
MSENKTKKWRCEICFEEFEGDEPPVPCPVCGAGRDQFVEITPKASESLLEDINQNILIIGNGAAGYYAAKTIRDKSVNTNITIVSSEEYLSYYRPQVSSYLSMDKIENNMFISSAAWYSSNNINLMLGETVTKLDVENKNVILADGRNLSYDKLILANGSRSSILPVKGIEKTNVFTLRDIKDADNIKASMKDAKNAVVIGGGLLGLEAAWELKQSGLNVTVVEFMPNLLPRQLDEPGAKIFRNYVDESGVTILLGESAEEILGDGKVDGLKLKSGKTLAADLVLFSVGIKPNAEITENTSINKNRGILVNERMETNIEGVYACGDVAEINGRVYGNWPASIEMGKVAGSNVLGEKTVFADFVSSTIFDGMGVKMFSCGDINPSFEALEIKDENESFIKKIFFKDGVVVGGYLIGDTSSAQNIVKAIVDKATFESLQELSSN